MVYKQMFRAILIVFLTLVSLMILYKVTKTDSRKNRPLPKKPVVRAGNRATKPPIIGDPIPVGETKVTKTSQQTKKTTLEKAYVDNRSQLEIC